MPQAARRVMMVEPVGFAPDETTADDNAYQAPAGSVSGLDCEALGRSEFERVVAALRSRGVRVEIQPGDPANPDGVFPNNWFSTHEGGTLVLYPMRSPVRRRERRPDLVEWLTERYPVCVDLTSFETEGEALEGTGSLVLDRVHKVAFAARSKRTSERLVYEWCERMGYRPLVFDAFGRSGLPVYHTNVVMSVGTEWAVVCTAVMPRDDAHRVIDELKWSGRKVVTITEDQMEAFGANVLELQGANGPMIVMSTTAERELADRQLDALGNLAEVVAVEVPTIERVGGGGVRCMLAELH